MLAAAAAAFAAPHSDLFYRFPRLVPGFWSLAVALYYADIVPSSPVVVAAVAARLCWFSFPGFVDCILDPQSRFRFRYDCLDRDPSAFLMG